MEQKVISQGQLLQLLMGTKGATFATIVTETDPKLKKTNNPLAGQVVKQSKMNVTLNFIYENSVNSQRSKEGADANFEAKPRVWGAKIPGTSIIEHNGQTYVEAKMNGKPQDVTYLHVNTRAEISKDSIEAFLPKKSSNAEHQGVEKEIILRDFSLNSIKEIAFKGIHYIIR